MKKGKISVVQIEKKQNSETSKQALYRAERFSRAVHKEDNTIKEGNSATALEWAKQFFVK